MNPLKADSKHWRRNVCQGLGALHGVPGQVLRASILTGRAAGDYVIPEDPAQKNSHK